MNTYNKLIDNNSVYQTMWSKFPFLGFEKQKSFIPFWKKWALKILQLLYDGNVAVVAETGAGKTILAHLVATARFNRVLFLVPERILAPQHKELLKSMTNDEYTTQIMLGNTPHKKRVWDQKAQFIFATPQTFVADFNRYKTNMNFDLVVFDEFHHGVGNFDYVKIATLCEAFKVKTLLLSASPGKNESKIEEIRKTLHITHFLYVPSPQEETLRSSYPCFISVDDNLTKIDKIIQTHMKKILYKMREFLPHICPLSEKFLSQNKIEKIENLLKEMPDNKTKYKIVFFLAVYRKLEHLLHTALTETYSTACLYWEKLLADKSKSAKYIKEQQDIVSMMNLVQSFDDSTHPKVKQLIWIISQQWSSTRGVIFINNRQTGSILQGIIQNLDKKVETLYGKTSVKKQRKILSDISTGTVDYIIATSVIEEGVSISEIGFVINFSMPITEKARIQRMGRTGRTTHGEVYYIVLDHPFDKVMFFATARGVKTMKEIVSKETSVTPEVIKKRKPEQLSFFN